MPLSLRDIPLIRQGAIAKRIALYRQVLVAEE